MSYQTCASIGVGTGGLVPTLLKNLILAPTFFDVLHIHSFQEITMYKINIMNFVANHTNNKSTYSPFVVFIQQ